MYQPKIIGVNVIRSFSLVEILFSLTLSGFLLFVISQYYVGFYRNNDQQQEEMFLQQSVEQIVYYFRQHIENINYHAYTDIESNISLFITKHSYQLKPSCLMFLYDVNSDGCIGEKSRKGCIEGKENTLKDLSLSKETFGFKLKNQEIYIYDQGNKFEDCEGNKCKLLLNSCNNGEWHRLTYANQFRVEKLLFSWKKKGKLLELKIKVVSNKQPSLSYETTAMINLWNSQ